MAVFVSEAKNEPISFHSFKKPANDLENGRVLSEEELWAEIDAT